MGGEVVVVVSKTEDSQWRSGSVFTSAQHTRCRSSPGSYEQNF